MLINIKGKVMLLIENDFQDTEFIYPYNQLKEDGFEVDLLGAKKAKTYSSGYGLKI